MPIPSMHALLTYIGVLLGVNVVEYASPMDGHVKPCPF